MRLFVAVYPPNEVLDEVARTAGALGAADRLDAAKALDAAGRNTESDLRVRLGRGLRWEARANWHLTLLFLGEVPEAKLPVLRERLAAEAARHERPSVAIRGGGTFPGDTTQAQVLWAGLEGDVGTVTELAAGLRKCARKAGIPSDRRAFVPHLTLARSSGPSTDMTALRYGLGILATPFWAVSEVHLVASDYPHQPRYRTLTSWALG